MALGLLQGRNQLFISGGNFQQISFDDIIVLIQTWCKFFANVTDKVLFAIFPKIITFQF